MAYLSINSKVSMFLTKDTYNVIIEKIDKQNKKFYEYFSVNKTGKLILEYIDGTEKTPIIIKKFIQDNSLKETDGQWIAEFIQDMINKGILLQHDSPRNQPNPILIFGESDLISPMHVTIEITEKCNLYCAHCYLNASCNKTTAIDFNTFKNLVTELKENNVLSIELTGGEVFMNKDADAILDLAFSEFAKVAILTNGTILKKSSLEILKRNKDKLIVSISLDSVNEETHDAFRGVKGAFKNTCKTIKRLSNEGIHVRVASSIFDKNMWEIDQLAELSMALGAKIFVYNFIEDFGRGSEFNESSTIASSESYRNYLNNTIKKYKDLIPIIESEYFLKASSNCGAGTNSFLLGADGDVRPCAMFPKNKMFGNIFKEGFTNLFDKDIYKQISEIHPPAEENGCSASCPNYLSCLGCYMKGLEKNYDKSPEDYCSWIKKNNLEDFMQVYKEGRVI